MPQETPLLMQLVPQLGIVLTAVGIVINISKELFTTRVDLTGLVPVARFQYSDRRAVLARAWVPNVTLGVFANCGAVGLFSLLDRVGLGIDIRWGENVISPTDPTSISMFVVAMNLTLIVLTAWVAHLSVTARQAGSDAPRG